MKQHGIILAYCTLCKMHKLRIGYVNAQYMCKILSQCAIYAQDLRKIVFLSPINAQYMCKICARLYLFLQCAIYAQDCTSFPNAQYMCKIRLYLFSPMRKIVLLSSMCNICARLQALLEEICHISHICSKFRMVFIS